MVCVGNLRSLSGAAHVLARIGDIQDTLKTHTVLLQSILRKLAAGSEPATMPEGINFPLTCIEDFDALENSAVDCQFENALVG